jgi:hypothetical protein
VLKLKFPDNYLELFVPPKEDKDGHLFTYFYIWIIKELHPSLNVLFDSSERVSPSLLKRIDPGAVSVSLAGDNKIKEAFVVWVKRIQRCGKKQALRYYPMEALNYGPGCYKDYRPTWITEEPDSSYIYINEDRLFRKE